MSHSFAKRLRPMKKITTSTKAIRALSILIVPACFLIEFFLSVSAGWVSSLASAFLCADFVIILHPSSSGKQSLPFVFASAIFLSACISPLLGIPGMPACLSAGWASVFLLVRYVCKFRDLKPLFKNDAPMSNLEDFSTAVHFSFVMFFVLLMQAGAVWPSLVLSAAGYVILYRSALSDRLPALTKERENSVRDIIKGNLRSSPYVEMDVDSRMNSLYSRAVEYMESRQPFLDENFSLAAMSTALFTNKCYLSRVINYYSGRNFKQFVNYYRIRYAVDMIRKDPRLSVLELATMSGFHSVVTFNVAFRLNMNDTPGSYCRNVFV